MSSRRTDDIEALSEQIGSLQITEEASEEYKQTTMDNMSVAPAPETVMNNGQAELPKNMVPDPG